MNLVLDGRVVALGPLYKDVVATAGDIVIDTFGNIVIPGNAHIAGRSGYNPYIIASRAALPSSLNDVTYIAGHPTGIGGGIGYSKNFLRATPFFPGKSGIIDTIGVRVTANGTTGAVCRLGVYSSNSVTGLPSKLLADGGEIVMDAGSVPRTVRKTISLAVGTDLLWFVHLGGVATSSVLSTNTSVNIPAFGGIDSNFSQNQSCIFSSFAYAALPSEFPYDGTVGWTVTNPAILIQYL